jgi:hypothetical protein
MKGFAIKKGARIALDSIGFKIQNGIRAGSLNGFNISSILLKLDTVDIKDMFANIDQIVISNIEIRNLEVNGGSLIIPSVSLGQNALNEEFFSSLELGSYEIFCDLEVTVSSKYILLRNYKLNLKSLEYEPN